MFDQCIDDRITILFSFDKLRFHMGGSPFMRFYIPAGSTVMIGIITYVSVVERIKEIGVIRSIGGRKKDVSHLFNAETFIIGLLAGIIGIGFTLVVSLIGSAVLKYVTGIPGLVQLKLSHALILIALSVGLTLISGLIPARSAANKDPIEALRVQ